MKYFQRNGFPSRQEHNVPGGLRNTNVEIAVADIYDDFVKLTNGPGSESLKFGKEVFQEVFIATEEEIDHTTSPRKPRRVMYARHSAQGENIHRDLLFKLFGMYQCVPFKSNHSL